MTSSNPIQRLTRWTRRTFLHYRLALILIATFLLLILVTLPFTIANIVDQVVGMPDGEMLVLTERPPAGAPTDDQVQVHIVIVALDEVSLQSTLRVSGQRSCAAGCPDDLRVTLFAFHAEPDEQAGLAPSQAITVHADHIEATQTIVLPIRGNPIRYPFDHYRLGLVLRVQRIGPDGKPVTVPREELRQILVVSIHEQLTRQSMDPPQPLPDWSATFLESVPGSVPLVNLEFERPPYLQVLSVALVLLIAAASAGAVFTRPVRDLFFGSGTLIIGVWGVRTILVPGTPTYLTSVDISLSVIILFLLSGIIVRLLLVVRQSSRPPDVIPPD